MRYTVLYPNTSNVNLIKEMGMIPYKLHKLFDYDAHIACYKQDEYTYLEKEVKGLKIDFIDKKFNNYSLDGMRFLKKEAKNIDILHIFHVTLFSVFYALRYKQLNPKGKIYLKLDCSHKLIDRILGLNSIQKKFLNMYFNKVDLISAEQDVLFNKLIELLPEHKSKFINIPNGLDFDYLQKEGIEYDYSKKENIILNVARLGAEEKNTQMLLQAFSKIKNIENSGWKLVLVGTIEKGFEEYIDDYYKQNPHLKDIVIFKGEISDRKKLFQEYSKSKIFCMTSNFESFGFAYIEAAALGNVIVSTDVGIARELIQNNNGALVKPNDVNSLAIELEKLMNCNDLERFCDSSSEVCREKFDWDKIIQDLHYNLEKLK